MSIILFSLVGIIAFSEGRVYVNRIFLRTIPGLTSNKEYDYHTTIHDNVYHIKLSPVPFNEEAPVGGVGPQYEVMLAPSAPSNNFILHPIQPFQSNGHYNINLHGNPVQGPYPIKPLNFQEAPPVFPHLSDDELTMLGQPVALHNFQDTNRPGSLEDVNTTVQQQPRPLTGTSLISNFGSTPYPNTEAGVGFPHLMSPAQTYSPSKPSSISQNQHMASQLFHPQSTSNQNKPHTTTAHDAQPSPPKRNITYAPAAQPVHQLHTVSEPFSVIKPPGGVYIATVNHGSNQPSTVFTCVQTNSLEENILLSEQYSPGPLGYSCRASKGRPLLSNILLSVNGQRPVSQPTLNNQSTLLPTIFPIQFS